MRKTRYSAGEPIVLVFTVKNIGTKAKQIHLEDPYDQCSDYKIIGLHRKDSEFKRDGPAVPKELGNLQEFDCFSGATRLAPHREYRESFRLNEIYEMNRPGQYHIDVIRILSYGEKGVLPRGNWSLATFKKSFKFTVD